MEHEWHCSFLAAAGSASLAPITACVVGHEITIDTLNVQLKLAVLHQSQKIVNGHTGNSYSPVLKKVLNGCEIQNA